MFQSLTYIFQPIFIVYTSTLCAGTARWRDDALVSRTARRDCLNRRRNTRDGVECEGASRRVRHLRGGIYACIQVVGPICCPPVTAGVIWGVLLRGDPVMMELIITTSAWTQWTSPRRIKLGKVARLKFKFSLVLYHKTGRF